MRKSIYYLRLFLAGALLSATAAVSTADLTISQDDFDGNSSGFVDLFANNLTATVTTDPTDASNMVAEIDISPGGVWGTYFQTPIDMAANGISIGDTIDYSYDVYVPADTNAGEQDRVSLIVRWGDSVDNVPNQGNTTLDIDRFNHPDHNTNLPLGEWVTISNSIEIPADNFVPDPPIETVAAFTPIWSFYDNDQDPNVRANPGTTLYVDNWNMLIPGIDAGPSLACDFNGDAQCDAADLDALYENWGGGGAFDVDGNGTVEAADISAWLTAASDPSNPYLNGERTFVLGDVDLDGNVNSTDLGLLLNNFNDESGLLHGAGNLNDDTLINSVDLGLLLNNFGATSAAVAVPEPSSLWIVSTLLCAFVAISRRR